MPLIRVSRTHARPPPPPLQTAASTHARMHARAHTHAPSQPPLPGHTRQNSGDHERLSDTSIHACTPFPPPPLPPPHPPTTNQRRSLTHTRTSPRPPPHLRHTHTIPAATTQDLSATGTSGAVRQGPSGRRHSGAAPPGGRRHDTAPAGTGTAGRTTRSTCRRSTAST